MIAITNIIMLLSICVLCVSRYLSYQFGVLHDITVCAIVAIKQNGTLMIIKEGNTCTLTPSITFFH